MSTLTKEWLLKTIAELEEERDATPGAVNEDAARALEAMKIALASLEADVVAWTDEQELRDVEKYGCGYLFTANPVTPNADPHRVIKLYAAPPVPVSVPDLLEQFAEFMAAESIKSGDYPDGWQSKASNAAHEYAQNIRAAMLQGAEPVSNRDELPDGWVACSERMPEDEQEVITHNIFGYRHVSFFDEHSGNFFNRLDGSPVDCVEHVMVSHWMPLPAAPQQEVK
ncbi:DUF551 domain-containing protein [Enterobacter hormaechei]|uniref:DUF551 domain-containing protein n=1 Tax=Enterobacter cloacae complex TaxID=354276 RepID=UPI000799D2DB|nr:DUF551 domain-containing protein [Enterobacter hormaechei]MCL8105290.1 DUF551 domain-containing protein [Enterobacter hormaechei]MCM8309083.1 DUF551 domain-containing protein [Enterobacter hormaechei]MCM8369941.1 DUF551 domain-containing protein [Enterobacter hormaechei]MCM8374973.1 DUF551 domain-containing protein [Enterobacter hormaechei]MCM8379897.1 DUF551 domain-containing protein [Enterobacter hormaechei]